jgi:hypothetical protein
MLNWIKILYYRLTAFGSAFRESARDTYVSHAVRSQAIRVLLTAEGFIAAAARPDAITLEFAVRVSGKRFPAGDDRFFIDTLFALDGLNVRVDGRPADVIGVDTERAGRDSHDNFWSASITARSPGASLAAGSEIVIEAGNAAATFVLGTPVADDTRPFEAPGVREFVTRLKPGDFDDGGENAR